MSRFQDRVLLYVARHKKKKKDKTTSLYELMFRMLNFVLIFLKYIIVVLNDKM